MGLAYAEELEWKDPWDRDRPAVVLSNPSHMRGTPYAGEQAAMVCRWDVRTFWRRLAEKAGMSQNAAMVAVELWAEAIGKGRWTSYSRSDEHYAKYCDVILYTKRRVVGGVEELDRLGLVEHFRQLPYNFGWQSCCRAKGGLVAIVQETVDEISRPYPAAPQRVLLVRGPDGEPIPYRHTAETRRQVREVLAQNKLIAAADISHGAGSQLRRIFTGDTNHGGRHYALGGAFQQMSKWERGRITINGIPVVEYDYGSIHASLLYGEMGLDLPEDAYDLPWWDRDLQKTAFCVMVNAPTRDIAINAIAEKEAMGVITIPGSVEASRVATALYLELENRHRAIASSLGSGAGLRLMKTDSDMMASAMRQLRQEGEVSLPMHDALIVKATAEDLLKDVLRRVADATGLHGIRIEKVVPKPPEEMAKKADSRRRSGSPSNPYPAGLSASNVMSYPSLCVLSSPFQDREQILLQPDSTIQNLAPCASEASATSEAAGRTGTENPFHDPVKVSTLPDPFFCPQAVQEAPQAVTARMIRIRDLSRTTEEALSAAETASGYHETYETLHALQDDPDVSQPHLLVSVGDRWSPVRLSLPSIRINLPQEPSVSSNAATHPVGHRISISCIEATAKAWRSPSADVWKVSASLGSRHGSATAESREDALRVALELLQVWMPGIKMVDVTYDGLFDAALSEDENRRRYAVETGMYPPQPKREPRPEPAPVFRTDVPWPPLLTSYTRGYRVALASSDGHARYDAWVSFLDSDDEQRCMKAGLIYDLHGRRASVRRWRDGVEEIAEMYFGFSHSDDVDAFLSWKERDGCAAYQGPYDSRLSFAENVAEFYRLQKIKLAREPGRKLHEWPAAAREIARIAAEDAAKKEAA